MPTIKEKLTIQNKLFQRMCTAMLMRKHLKANKWLWIISALTAIVVVCFLIIPRDGHNFEVDGICYEILDDISNIVKVTYKGNDYKAYEHEYSGAIVIPEELTYKGKKYKVTEIGDYAFCGCGKITSISIPESVWCVGIGAFSGCDGLNEIHINNLSAWCEMSFYDVTDDVGESPLNYADRLYLNGELITDLVVPNDVIEIGAHSFEGYKNLRSVVFHKGISAIHKSAFLNCGNLTDVTFADEVEYIGPYTFAGTPWYENKPDGEVYIGNLLYKYKGEMPSNTSITIKDGTETICESAFDYCEGLTSITLPSSLKDIQNYAFYQCKNLKEIYCKALTPPSINSFYNNFHNDAVIYVPRGTREAYREDSRLFENVVEADF